MKANKLALASLLIAGMTGTSSAAIILGDVISVDFGSTAPSTANWNQFTRTGAAGDFSTNNLVRLADGANTGVSITLTGATTTNNGGNGANHLDASAFGGSSNATIYGDHIFDNTGGSIAARTLTFNITGLDESLTYNLVGGFLRDSNAFENTYTVGTDSRNSTESGGVYNNFHTFSNIGVTSIDGGQPVGQQGVITLTVAASSAADIASISELTITAVPEPSSTALLSLGGLALILRRRK
ncbi:PEP-CTERM sorting domain-containing protein [Rubritalea spongiae]|uniref:PEP-CTERM sorting domain-containing protein n=1 Tax=Rubritalea spongiae TaxID=430797 RepID=A0ABW5E469_9BACT